MCTRQVHTARMDYFAAPIVYVGAPQGKTRARILQVLKSKVNAEYVFLFEALWLPEIGHVCYFLRVSLIVWT